MTFKILICNTKFQYNTALNKFNLCHKLSAIFKFSEDKKHFTKPENK